MVNVTFYNFTKEHNSTKQPASGAGASFACLVKEPCDILAPVIELDTPDPASYNYAYIPAWGRYYFITGIRFNAGLWELTARVDVLATYRAAIGAEELYLNGLQPLIFCHHSKGFALRISHNDKILDFTHSNI